MRRPPLRCRLFGHWYVHEYAYGAESVGHVVVICKRRWCGNIARTYTETNACAYPDGFDLRTSDPSTKEGDHGKAAD